MGLVALSPLQLAVVGAALLGTLLLGEVVLHALRPRAKPSTCAIAS
jgi:hypothetical protein